MQVQQAGQAQILQGDAIEMLRTLDDESVQCVVTSPPYFGLRDYGTAEWDGGSEECEHIAPATGSTQNKGNNGKYGTPFRDDCGLCGATRIDRQIGLESTPAEYIEKMVAVFREVRRVLRKDGVCFVNLGDSYFGGGRGGGGSYEAERRGWRDVPCGTFGTAQADSRASDRPSESLCDGCLAAVSSGSNPHNDRSPVVWPPASLDWSSHAHTESASDHPPTSDCSRQADHIEGATQDQPQQSARDDELPHVVQASSSGESFQQLPAVCCHCANCGACLRVLASSSRDALLCVRRADGISGIESLGDSSGWHRSDKSFSGLAYPYLTTPSLKPKDLIGMPWRLAFALQADGWYLRQDIIWAKPNPMPESVTDRCTKAHEYIFLLSKSERYYYDADAIREPLSDATLDRWRGVPVRIGPNGVDTIGHSIPNGHERTLGANPDGRNKRSVWTITTEPYPEAHFATFPTELPRICILAGSRIGDTILDPFAGSGTTLQVALELSRAAIGIELNAEYVALANRRLNSTTLGLPLEIAA